MSIYDVFSGGSKPFDKEQWAAQKQAQRKEAYELIDNTCSEMMISGDSFRQYLDVQGRFDRYSVNNAILVSAQMPEATQLKEKAAWKQSRVYVNKDAQKVVILEPSKEYTREDGSKAVGYNAKEVYDISETSAKDRQEALEKKHEYESFLNNKQELVDIEQTEEAMQKIMDQYAGGISTDYQYNEARLELADEKIKFLEQSIDNLAAQDADDLLRIYEIRERLTVCRSVIAHLKARKETRWHSFAENMDYPAKSDDWLKYVNSRKENGEIKIIIRDLVRGGDSYEHSDK